MNLLATKELHSSQWVATRKEPHSISGSELETAGQGILKSSTLPWVFLEGSIDLGAWPLRPAANLPSPAELEAAAGFFTEPNTGLLLRNLIGYHIQDIW